MPKKTNRTKQQRKNYLADLAVLINPAVAAAFIHWKKNGRYRVTLLQYADTSQMHPDEVAKYGTAEAYNLMAAELCRQIQEVRGDCDIVPYREDLCRKWLGSATYGDNPANRAEWAARIAREQRSMHRFYPDTLALKPTAARRPRG